ncbi:MAG: hypothetical protein A2X18_07470 [Bacteroidetes bacterium GWF2_40_14]|nr:MAG: hypothetical protein A2X18_07470 [Bacteroidetes bacterium GWF2_40_14]
MEETNSSTKKDVKINLAGYYDNLPEKTSPKTDFVRELAWACNVDAYTVRNWLKGRTKPLNPKHVEIISSITGINAEDLF